MKKETKSIVYIYRDSDHQDIKVFRNLRDAKACKWGDEEWEGDDDQSSRWEAGEYERIYKCEAERVGGKYILASDFDAREAKWKEVVRELVKLTNPLIATNYMELQRLCKKALTLLNDQPQEDKP